MILIRICIGHISPTKGITYLLTPTQVDTTPNANNTAERKERLATAQVTGLQGATPDRNKNDACTFARRTVLTTTNSHKLGIYS